MFLLVAFYKYGLSTQDGQSLWISFSTLKFTKYIWKTECFLEVSLTFVIPGEVPSELLVIIQFKIHLDFTKLFKIVKNRFIFGFQCPVLFSN